ncbi:MAG: mucoidy inhibitor MuiA family protein [Clostridiales bacterium]|nr:mucoidy inhibitor MuiA family protein [Clostridiales bacterium]
MNVQTAISKVQLYRSGAVVTRSGVFSLPAGPSTVTIEGLTTSAQTDSLRLAFPAGVLLEDVRIIENEDQSAAEQLAHEIDRIDRKIESLQTEMDLLQQNGDFTHRSAMDLNAMQDYISALPDRFDQLFLKIQSCKDERNQLQKKYYEQQARDTRPLVQASLRSDEALQCPFTLSYRETQAGWDPVYELHFAGETEPLVIRQRARLVQRTPEDWTLEDVTLFTGNPSISNEIPALTRQEISLTPPFSGPYYAPPMYAMAAPKSTGLARRARAKLDSADMDTTAALPELFDAETSPVEEQSQDTMTSFALSGMRTIPSNADGSLADLKTYRVPASYQITAVPSKSSTAWLTARIKGNDWPLQQITAALYLRGIYGGKVTIAPNTTEDDFLLSLGRDERVQVRRDKQLDRKQDQLLKKHTVQHLSFEIRVLSQLPQAVALEILDRIPVTNNNDIQVEPIDLSGAAVQAETGKVTWKATLDPGQTLIRTLSYDLTWPRGRKIYQYNNDTKPSSPFDPPMYTERSRFCPECGFQLPDASVTFCPRCGNAL